jgi:DNA-binding PadR family transcriptional regulator
VSTTGYAILGLLAIQPWTSYQLTRQMDRGVGRFWPRARSKLYEEPKKLVAQGLARASTEACGRRERTVYSITARGRRALARWLVSPGEGPELEFEQLLKVFFAEHGSKRELLATLAASRRWADERKAENAAIAREYLAGAGLFPERLAHLLLVGRFLSDMEDAVARWAEWATAVVEAWPDDISAAEPDWETLEQLARRGDRRVSPAPRGPRGAGRAAHPPRW